jgi:DhnA family fructose-bisphosphate aldolase class Ia
MGIKARLNRLLSADGRCVNVAVDHGYFGEAAFLDGIENMPEVIRNLVMANPDAIQLTVGMAELLQTVPGKQKPSLVLRVDTANIYGKQLPTVPFNKIIDQAVEQAVRVDAAAICANLFVIPGCPEIHSQCVENINRLKPVCDQFGMPLMVEPLVFQLNQIAGGYMVDGDLSKIMTNVRQAVELGADVIKADPSDELSEYHRVVEVAAGKPVLVRGGSKASDEEILHRTSALMEQGAGGVVYGRNVIQHTHPAKMVGALMALVHQGWSVEQALGLMS